MVLLRSFRSVYIYLGENRSEIGRKVNDWLNRFDDWYRSESDINSGCNLHLLYKRDVVLSADRLLSQILSLRYLIDSCTQRGFTVTLKASLNECYEFSSELKAATEEIRPLSLIIDATNFTTSDWPQEFAFSFIENLASNVSRITFIGETAFWLKSGVASSEVLGNGIYEIIPFPKKEQRHSWGNYNPCSKKFMLYIDHDGSIYPCIGLAGAKICSVGDIGQSLPVIWNQIENHFLNLEQLSRVGPELNTLSVSSDEGSFHSICESHRNSVVQEHKKSD